MHAFLLHLPSTLPPIHVSPSAVSRPVSCGHPRAAAYAASTAGINGLVRALALELAPFGARANAVAPGPIATPMTETARHDPDRRQWLIDQIPLGRFGEADEVARVLLFLASDAASYITGQVVPVDGGVTTK